MRDVMKHNVGKLIPLRDVPDVELIVTADSYEYSMSSVKSQVLQVMHSAGPDTVQRSSEDDLCHDLTHHDYVSGLWDQLHGILGVSAGGKNETDVQ